MTKPIESDLSYEQACREVFDCLSQVDVNEHTSDKNGLTYLSWAWAVDTIMKKYPTFNYEMDPVTFYANGSAEVSCTVWVIHGGQTISKPMWLPVMEQQRGKQISATINPDSLAINKTKMRCLTKAMSMLGLGAYIYAGQDLPSASTDDMPAYGDDMAGGAYQPSAQPTVVPAAPIANEYQAALDQTMKTFVNPAPIAVVAPAPTPQAVIQPQTGTNIADESGAEEITVALINIAKSMHSSSIGSLVEFWQINKQTIDALDGKFPNQYAKLKAAFTEIKQALSQPQEATS